MARGGKWRPCTECVLSVKRDSNVRDGRLTVEQFIAELKGRLIRDREYVDTSPLLKRRRAEARYHCLSCKMVWGIVTIDGIGSTVFWHPTPSSD